MAQHENQLFVGGLSYDTTNDSLQDFFSQFGEVTNANVAKDRETQRSRGFGFVSFSSGDDLDAALAAKPHTIDGRTVEPKRALPRDSAGGGNNREATKKVFIGGLKDGIEEHDLRSYFSNYGTLEKVDIILDKETGRNRGFGFLTFDDNDTVDKLVSMQNHTINGHMCVVKKAVSRDRDQQGGGRGGFGGGRGRGRGGGGGYGGQGGYGGGGYGGGASYGSGGGYGSGGYGDSSGYGSHGSGYDQGGYGGGPIKSSYSQHSSTPYGGGGYGAY